jgi:hypothetical protein
VANTSEDPRKVERISYVVLLSQIHVVRLTNLWQDESLLRQAAISALPVASHHDLFTLQHWLEMPGEGNLSLIGEDRKAWGYTDDSLTPASDLIAVNRNNATDPFSLWVLRRALQWFHERLWHPLRRRQDEERGMVTYEDESVIRWTAWISTAVSSLLPVVSTIVLYCISDIKWRLGFTAIFTFMFSLALMAFTKATSVEIFTATAA